MNPLSDAASARGADMGRNGNVVDTEFPVNFEAQRLNWVDGAYDEGGAYWGRVDGDHIFRFEGESADTVEKMFVRAKNLTDAKATVVKTYPIAAFEPSADLNALLDGYRDCALWSSSNDRYENDPDNEKEILGDTGYALSGDAEAWFRHECESFFADNEHLIREAITDHVYTLEQAGHDFWLARNGHGADSRDRDIGTVGDKLYQAAKEYSGEDLYVGDDDLIHAHNEYKLLPQRNLSSAHGSPSA